MVQTWFVDDPDLDGPAPYTGLLTAVALATRATVHTTMNATLCQLVFGQDAFLRMEFQADWNTIRARKQARINENNVRENQKRIPHTYNVGDRILIKNNPKQKFGTNAYAGPYLVTEVRNNGTIRYRKGNIFDTNNIRNVSPYHE